MRCIDDEIPFEIPATWCWVRLRNYAEIVGGYAFPSAELKTDKGLRVIRISDISEEGFVNKSIVRYNAPNSLDNYKIAVDDILIAMTGGTVGKSLYVQSLSEDMLLNQRVAIIRNKWFDVKYIDCVIKSPHIKEYINSRKNSTNDNISMVDIANFLIPIPSLSEQKRIIDKYQEILPSIDKYKECQENLDALSANLYTNLKKSILQEAIQGRLVEQCVTEEPAYLLLERINEEKKKLVKQGVLRKKDLKDSLIFKGDDNKYYEKCGNAVACIDDEIPFEIPDTWCWCKIGDLFMHNNGKQLNKGNSRGKLMEYITTSNLYWDGFVLENLKQMPFEDSEIERCTAKKGDLLVCEGGDVGRACIWPYDQPIMLQNHLHKLRAYLPICTEYIYYVFYLYNQMGIIGGKGIGIQGFSSKALHNTKIPLPPLEEQRRIVAKIQQALASIMSR